jgi:peptidoglycan-N-acetylglucosamine deacetylase
MPDTNGFPWPNGYQGAVSMSFDDGSQSQLDIAIPILKEYELLGTFYINPRGDDWKERFQPWREVALAGHEVGNHTIQHICTRNFGWGGGKSLETITLDELEADVVEAERRLNELIPEHPVRTFCYPCYQNYVGEGPARQSYVPIIAKHFPAARGIGEAANHPELTDMHYLSSTPVAGWMSGKNLCQMADVASEQSRWVVMTFHGFQLEASQGWRPGSYHGSALPADCFRVLCEYLAERRDTLWIAPVVTVAQEIIAWRKGLSG